MEYQYYLEGLGCANCAAKMEHAISRHKEVKSANVVFMKKKLIVEPKAEMTETLFQDIKEIVTGIEDHVRVLPFGEHDQHGEEGEHHHEHHHENGGDCCCGEEHEHHHENGGDCCCGEEHEHHHEHHHEHEEDCHCGEGHEHYQKHQHGKSENHGHSHEAHGHSHGEGGSGRINAICMALGIVLLIAAVLFDKFDMASRYVVIPLYLVSYFLIAYDVLWQSVKHIRRGQVFDEFFLMSVATIGALAIGEFPEAAAVMLFYKTGEYFQDKAVSQARGSIEALVNIKPDYANLLLADGKTVRKNPEEISIGELIEIKAGEKIPLDGEIVEGSTSLDMAALTGETKPVDVLKGDRILSGSINLTGCIKVRVEKAFGDSTVARIMDMVENAADKKSNTEQFITRFARIYTPIVCFLALALAVLPPLFGGDWSSWIYRALSFLVVSCPCALVISVPLGFFGGIGVASKNGILVKGSNYLEALADVSVIAFDKTGTLTKGSFQVSKVLVNEKGMEKAKHLLDKQYTETGMKGMDGAEHKRLTDMDSNALLLYLLSLAERKSNHPIGRSILEASAKEPSEKEILTFEESAGYGLLVDTVYGRVLAGNEKMMQKHGISCEKTDSPATIVYGALEDIYLGAVIISDEIKQGVKEGIESLAKEGISHTVLLSGDSNALVSEVAQEVGIEKAFGELLPGDKLEKIEQLYRENPESKVAYAGDGINDAPVLARVEVGIAMGGVGQDAAIEAADVVLMTDEIGKISQAVAISKYTRQIVMENILLALGIKVLVLILIAAGFSSMWMAVFADVGVALLAVCNSIRVYTHKFTAHC